MRRRVRGVALFTVLGITAILVAMTTAFVAINHSNFALMAAAGDQEEAVGACQAGYSYGLYALEHDRRFGKAFADGSSPPTSQLDDLSSLFTISVVNRNTLTAQLVGANGEPQNGSFTLEVVNNLPLDSIDTPPALPATASYPAVPPDCVFLRITGTSGGVSRVLETMLTYAPLFDASATAENLIKMNASEGITFDSKDRFRNFVRSNQKIDLLNDTRNSPLEFKWDAMEKELFRKLSQQFPSSPEADVRRLVEESLKGRKGELKARKDIEIKGGSTSSDASYRAAQERAANGRISPNSTREHQILDIKFEDFRLSDRETKEVQIKDGLYVFGSADYSLTYSGQAVWKNSQGQEVIANAGGQVDVSLPALERQVVTRAGADMIEATKTVERWVAESSMPKAGDTMGSFSLPAPPYPDNGGNWTFDRWAQDPTITYVNVDAGDGNENDSEAADRQALHMIDGNTVKLDDIVEGGLNGAPADSVIIDISRADFRVRENVLLKSAGEFGVLAERDRFRIFNGEASTRRVLDAKLHLGVTAESMRAATPNIGEKPSAVQADGQVRVRNVRGRGALVASDDLTLAAGGNTVSDELALYGGKNVILDPNSNRASTTGAESEATINTDGASDAPADSIFRGLVYARKDFIVGNTHHPFDVHIEGSLVARNEIRIRNAKKVDLIYNPIFSRRMLKDRPDYDVRLERQSYNLY